jgi:hypothetical protein
MEWDRVYFQNYKSKTFSENSWLKSARALIYSAKELEPKVLALWESYRANSKDKTAPLMSDDYQGPYYMLMSYAVENLFKAKIVKKESIKFKKDFENDKKFPKELQSHDLVDLAQKANFPFNIEEEDLLRRLTWHAIWAGRYPSPLNYVDSSGSKMFTDGKEYSVRWYGGKDVEKLSLLIENIYTKLGFKA